MTNDKVDRVNIGVAQNEIHRRQTFETSSIGADAKKWNLKIFCLG